MPVSPNTRPPTCAMTVGYAHHKDFHGGAFTLQDIKLDTPPDVLKDMEVICVDQSPGEEESKELQKLWRGHSAGGLWGAQYHEYTERVGTSHSRGLIFEKAHGRIVVVMDCHVLLPAAARHRWYDRIREYFEDPVHAKDILSGPILNDNIRRRDGKWSTMATHYADHWRAQMWGTWAGTYQCTCGGWYFATWSEGNLVRYEDVTMAPKFHKECPACGKRLPLLDWSGHDRRLEDYGYKNVGADGGEPFEISGQGLGFFAMLKEHWPGMPEGLWGFGGEELSLHSLVRANGGRAVCDPEIPWWHRFQRPGGTTYPNTCWYKARNYVVWFNRLRELTGDTARYDLEHIRRHFMDEEKVMPTEDWRALVEDPLGHVHGPTDKHVQPVMVGGQPQAYYKRTIEEAFEAFRNVPRDLNEHFMLIRELAANCDHVTLFGKRKEADLAFAMGLVDRARATGKTPKMVSHNLEKDTLLFELDQLLLGPPAVRATTPPLVAYVRDEKPSTAVPELEEDTDALWLDTVHHADRTRGELRRFGPRVRRYIFIRGTAAFGIEAEGGGPGMYDAAREWCDEHPEWFVCYHTPNQYGITVLGCMEEDRPPKAIIPWPPGRGPGTELKKMLANIGIEQMPGCDCLGTMIEMDSIGVEGCKNNIDAYVARLKENAPRWGWQSKLGAAVWTVFTGLIWKINPTDPFPSLVKEAIRRAEADEVLREKGKKKI